MGECENNTISQQPTKTLVPNQGDEILPGKDQAPTDLEITCRILHRVVIVYKQTPAYKIAGDTRKIFMVGPVVHGETVPRRMIFPESDGTAVDVTLIGRYG